MLIINKNLTTLQTGVDISNFENPNEYYVIEDNSDLSLIALQYFPLIEIESDSYGNILNVTKKSLEVPPVIEGKKIELQLNDLNQWGYVYVDMPLTKEQELEEEIASLREMIENLVGGVE